MYHPHYGRLRMGPPGYYIDQYGFLIPEEDLNCPIQTEMQNTGFGAGFTPTQIASTGAITFIITLILGAGLPGALVMGMGSMITEAGSTHIPAGWRRYVLGLFRKVK